MGTANVFESVVRQLERMRAADPRLPQVAVERSSSLVTDLGLDSVSMVELACAVEEELGLDSLPLNHWLALEADKPDGRYSVEAFVQLALSTEDGGGRP